MRGDLTIRKTRTASGATAVQVVRYEGKRRIVVKHIGSAHDEDRPSTSVGEVYLKLTVIDDVLIVSFKEL